MGKSKIIFNGQTLIDLTGDTVTADTLLEGITAHGADGEVILGVMKAAGGLNVLNGTARPGTSNNQGQLLLNCALPEADFMFLHVEPEASISETSTSKVSHATYVERDGEVLLKSTWGGKTLNANGSTYLTIDHENGIVSSPRQIGTSVNYAVTYTSTNYRWWYIYG